MYKHFQQTAYEEIKRVIGNREPTYEDIKKMNFLNMFIKEGKYDSFSLFYYLLYSFYLFLVLRIAPPTAIAFTFESDKVTEINGTTIPPKV